MLLEGVARVFHLGSGGFWEPYPLYGWRSIPGASGWESCYGECATRVEINSLGLRDVETPYAKPDDERRILLLGDSMTAGFQVSLEETLGKVLQSELNGAQVQQRWRVLNAAVNGYGTDNELLFYRLEGQKYEPDLVVLGIYLANDVYNNSWELEQWTGGSGHKPYFSLDEQGSLQLHNYPVETGMGFPQQVGSLLKKYFQLPRFISQTLALRAGVPDLLAPLVDLFGGARGASEATASRSDPLSKGDICDDQYTPEIAQAWAITKALLSQLNDEVSAHAGQLVVLVIPAEPQTRQPGEGEQWYCRQPNRELSEFLSAAGIPYLDLLESFIAHNQTQEERLYFQRDFHMTAAGHQLAGEALYEFLSQEVIERQAAR